MFKTPRLRDFGVLLVLLLGLGVILLSIVPINRVKLGLRPPHSPSQAAVRRAARIHVLMHVVVFGAIADAVAWAATAVTSSTAGEPYATPIAFSFAMLLGFASEYSEHLRYRINLEVVDVLTNLVSIIAVFGVSILITRFRKSSRESQTGYPAAKVGH